VIIKDAITIAKHELKLEIRNKNALGGLILYSISTVFITYLSTEGYIPSNLFSALLWIILLFISINAAGKSFLQTNSGRHLFYFSNVSPQAYILGKHFFTSGLVLVLMFLVSGLSYFLFEPKIENMLFFSITIFLGSLGFAFTIGFLSAVAQTASGNFTMVSILSFPVLLPFFLTQIKLLNISLARFNIDLALKYIGILCLLNLLVLGLSYILFPYLWRD